MMRRALCLALLAAAGLFLAAGGALADDREDDDHDQALELLEQGEIHSLRDILESIAHELDGEVVSVELMQIKERWVYRLQIIDRQGNRTLVDVPANADVELDEDED